MNNTINVNGMRNGKTIKIIAELQNRVAELTQERDKLKKDYHLEAESYIKTIAELTARAEQAEVREKVLREALEMVITSVNRHAITPAYRLLPHAVYDIAKDSLAKYKGE